MAAQSDRPERRVQQRQYKVRKTGNLVKYADKIDKVADLVP